MKMNRLLMLLPLFVFGALASEAQYWKDGKIRLNEDGSNYFKFTLASQIWIRHTELNPGSTINGFARYNYSDIGVRRARIQAFGQIADRVFLYTQFGMNNFGFNSDRKAGFFIHDILGEYEAVREHLSLGTGLTAWSGLARFAAPSAGTILGIDAPLFEQNTNDVTDQFLRKLSVYAKGKFGKFDYRLILSNPMAVQRSSGYSAAVGDYSTFSARPAKLQWHGYFQYQFLDREANTTPYATGTYLGSKKVFNIGAGFQYQPDAMWHSGASATDTVETALQNFAVDAYYDAPINKTKGSAISAYAVYIHSDFGPGYTRNQGVMNPANGTTQPLLLNGPGNNYPSFGTGDLLYGQVGYKFADKLVGSTTLMPYASVQYADYDRLEDHLTFWDAGVNWLLKGHTSKLTLAYQNRPVYTQQAGAKAERTDRKGSVILQYQVFLN